MAAGIILYVSAIVVWFAVVKLMYDGKTKKIQMQQPAFSSTPVWHTRKNIK